MIVNTKTRLSPIRFLTVFVLVTGALISLFMTAMAGRRNHSIILQLLFAVWVLSPYVALWIFYLRSAGWPALPARGIYILIFVVTVASLIGYSGFIHLPGNKPAFLFLATPLISWFLIGITCALSYGWLRRKAIKGEQD